MTETPLIHATIDGRSIEVPKGTTVYRAAQQLGIDIPIFCYHDRMPPFGACRVCLVEVEKMPKLQASCTLELTEGMVVHTQSALADQGRKGIIEFLLINHPLDCPVCDKGGECPLQDQTMTDGPGLSNFYEKKRTFKKPLPLGPVLMLDRERCIACARCTRFGEIVSGDHALAFIERGYRTEVGTPHGGPVQSKFIGNTISICPVGALTSQVYRFRARPWDNKHTHTTCTLCPIGCSLTLDSRDGELLRTRACENRAVNDVWLCDKGWFGYEFVSHPERLRTPLIRRVDKLVPAQWNEAFTLIARKFLEARAGGKLAGFGGNPLTVEECYLFQQLLRSAGGVGHVDHRIGMPLFGTDEEGLSPAMEIAPGDCEHLAYACLLGVDITEEFPLLWLRLNKAIQKGAKIEFIGHYAPEVGKDLARVVVHAPSLEMQTVQEQLSHIQEQLSKGGPAALFVGPQYLSSPDRLAILAELLKLRHSYPHLTLSVLEGNGNSYGARWAGMHPLWQPFGQPAAQPGLNYLQVLEQAASIGWDYLHVAGANPRNKVPGQLWNLARKKLGFLVVQDLFLTETAAEADVVLPVLAFAEKEGSFLSIEGRMGVLKPGKDIPKEIFSDAEVFFQLARHLECALDLQIPLLVDGERLSCVWPKELASQPKTALASEELRATFCRKLFDQGVRMRHNKQLSQQVPEPFVRIHPAEGQRRNLQDKDRVQLLANGHTLHSSVCLDPGVASNTIVIPTGFPQLAVQEWGASLLNGLSVELIKD